MIALGLATPFTHDPSAALIIDGEVVAAVEEERLIRDKHAIGKLPIESIKYCLDHAGIKASDVDLVAFPWSFDAYQSKKWKSFWRTWLTRPSRAFKGIKNSKKIKDDATGRLYRTLDELGFDRSKLDIQFVEHHISHVASAHYFSGWDKSAVMSIDGMGEVTTTLLGEANEKGIHKILEVTNPDSLGRFYSTVTAYLGWEVLDGEYKLMGMAPFGDPTKYDFSHIIRKDGKSFKVTDDYVWPIRSQRHDPEKLIPKKMVRDWGPPREGDGLTEPYIHIAAATQKVFEEMIFHLIENNLKEALERCDGRLSFAGGCALNVALNRKIIDHPLVKELWVQPAAHDAGAALGAAAYALAEKGEKVKPMKHAYLGPDYSNEEIEAELKKHNYPYKKCDDIADAVSDILKTGEVVGWFQGRMEWGPRSLGARSIIGNPSTKGVADRINEIIKFRETWRPFCPSILPEHATDILESDHPSPFMTFAFKVKEEWRDKIPEVVHVDNTARPQIIDPEANPKYYDMVTKFHKKTGYPVVINTSLNRRGEPVVCNPHDAMLMFEGSGIPHMAMGDYLVSKE